MTQMMDAVSGMFISALGTSMSTMEEYFPFITMAFSIMQYTAWALLFLITVWQLFRAFGGPITEAENPWHLLIRSSIFALMIGFAKPIFELALDIARAPYTALMDASMNPGDFTFAGVEQALSSGLTTLVAIASIVGLLLLIILMVCLGWNYFKLLLEVVERYIVVGVLCYTSPLAYAMGGSKATNKVFQSWCRMVGSQLLLLVMNVWFLRGFNSSVGQFMANGGALTTGDGNIFLWMFCALAFLKTAQKFDSYLSSLGLSVAQTGSGMGMELMMASRVITGFAGGGGPKSAGSVFGGATSAAGSAGAAGAAGGFMAGVASKFKGNSFVRDAVVDGGSRMGAGGGLGFVGRAFGGVAARSGAELTGESVSSVASRPASVSGSIGGEIADRSLKNYMPHLANSAASSTPGVAGDVVGGSDGTPSVSGYQASDMKFKDTAITGGHISTQAVAPDGKEASVDLYNAAQYERPDMPHSVVSASDGSQWYQTATGDAMGAFYSTPNFSGDVSEAAQVASTFPDAPEGTTLRSVDEGTIEANVPGVGNSMWHNSAHYEEPDAPHSTMQTSDGVSWYAMQPHADAPQFDSTPPGESGGLSESAQQYNQAQFQSFMPGYASEVSQVSSDRRDEGFIEARHADGSGTAFYDKTMYQAPRGDYQVYEDNRGGQWYAIPGTAAVERKPVYENGKPVYDGDNVRSVNVESIRYKTTLTQFDPPQRRDTTIRKPPRKKQ